MSNAKEKQWYITTTKGTIKVSKKLTLEQAQEMAMLNSKVSGKTELHDENNIRRYLFINGKLVKGAVKVTSTNRETNKHIKDELAKVSGSPT